MEKTKKVRVTKESCKACYLCIPECPTKAISPSGNSNAKGYIYVQVDDELCIACGNCYRVCPDYVYEVRRKGAK